MSFDPDQFRDLIHRILIKAELVRDLEDAVELLMLTAAVESGLGHFLKQANGPAIGVYQMEPGTYHDLLQNYIETDIHLQNAVLQFQALGGPEEMEWNLAYATVMARINYLRFPEPLPDKEDPHPIAAYWKNYWNSSAGKGTVADALAAYKKYCSG